MYSMKYLEYLYNDMKNWFQQNQTEFLDLILINVLFLHSRPTKKEKNA